MLLRGTLLLGSFQHQQPLGLITLCCTISAPVPLLRLSCAAAARLPHAMFPGQQMPEELLYDPQVIELREEIRGLQGEFVASHKALDAAQAHVK